jgi:hypothetical protein
MNHWTVVAAVGILVTLAIVELPRQLVAALPACLTTRGGAEGTLGGCPNALWQDRAKFPPRIRDRLAAHCDGERALR